MADAENKNIKTTAEKSDNDIYQMLPDPEEIVSEQQETEKKPGFFARHKILWSFLVILVLLFVLLLTYLSPITKYCIEKQCSALLEMPLRIGSLDIRLRNLFICAENISLGDSKDLNTEHFIVIQKLEIMPNEGDIKVQNITIANPKGFNEKNILTLKHASVDIDSNTFSHKKLVIETFALDGLDFYFEPSMGKNNVQALQEYIERVFRLNDRQPEGKYERELQINKLSLTNINVHAVVMNKKLTLPIMDINLENLGSGPDGITAANVSLVVLDKLSAGATTSITEYIQNSKKYLENNIMENLNDAKKNVNDQLNEIKTLLQ